MPRKKETKIPKLPRGQGTFRKIGDALRYEKYHKYPDGFRSIRVSVTASTPQECFDLMAQKEKEVDEQYYTSGSNPHSLLEDAMMSWLKEERYGKIKSTSYDRIERTIKNQIKGSNLGRCLVYQVTSKDISDHLEELDYSLSVIKKTYDVLHQYFGYYCANSQHLNPMNKVQKPTKVRVVGELKEERNLFESEQLQDMVLSDEEIKRFKEWVYQPNQIGSQGRSRYGLALFFTMMTFLRSGEARTLRWKDLDIDHNRLQVNKSISRIINRSGKNSKTAIVTTTPKTESGTRIVMMTDEAKDAIIEYKRRIKPKSEDEFIFGTSTGQPISEGQVWRALRGIMYATNLKRDPKRKYKDDEPLPPLRDGFSMHYLRHSGISYYLRHEVPIDVISKMAGHSSVEVTRRVYYHIINDQTEDALKLMNMSKL